MRNTIAMDNIDKLIGKVNNKEFRANLEKIKLNVNKIWSPQIRLIKNFPSHDIDHSNRIGGYVLEFLKLPKGKGLSPEEYYLLTAAICLHDIGMQCDVSKYKEIMEKAIELGAEFDVEFTSEGSSDFSLKEQDSIRKNHHYLTAAWIDFAYKNQDSSSWSPLESCIKDVPPCLVNDLMDICMYHSKLSVEECSKEFKTNPNGRKRLLATVLRLADELDIAADRVSEDAYDAFRIPAVNKIHWWLHDHTKVYFKNNGIILKILLHPNDALIYGDAIKSLYIDKFKTKNQNLIGILTRYSIPICISDKSMIIENDHEERIPVELCQLILEQILIEHDSIYVLKEGERFSGLVMMSLEVVHNMLGDYCICELDYKKIYVPYNSKNHSILNSGWRKSISILRKNGTYTINIGPRYMDIGETVKEVINNVAFNNNENTYIILIGHVEIKLPLDVGQQVSRAYAENNRYISITRSESSYSISFSQVLY